MGVFESAITEKEHTDNCNPKTISSYRDYFHRYISDDFAKTDIRDITTAVLKAYTQDLVNSGHNKLKKKAFLQYKSLLNLIFRYALEYDIIVSNPVAAVKTQFTLSPATPAKLLLLIKY